MNGWARLETPCSFKSVQVIQVGWSSISLTQNISCHHGKRWRVLMWTAMEIRLVFGIDQPSLSASDAYKRSSPVVTLHPSPSSISYCFRPSASKTFRTIFSPPKPIKIISIRDVIPILFLLLTKANSLLRHSKILNKKTKQ
ncbi:hypothetical protein PtB15_10B547 [Puccinia triticina]|nr:hypothetical protein PtB15_10B547 [Puccinia triticina]